MKPCHLALPVIAAACLLTAGCASHPNYYVASAPPSPPAYNGVPPLIERADHAGFRTGSDDGARDAYNGSGHHPKHTRSYHDTPGYDPSLGPYSPYRDAFRQSYLRGYDQAFYRR